MTGPKTWVGIPFLLIGLLMTFGALWQVIDANRIAVGGVEAKGTVVGMQRGATHRPRYRPIVSFMTPDGATHTFAHRLSGRLRAYDVGEKVDVLYDPQNPDRAVIDSLYGRFAFAFVAIFTSAFAFLGLGLIYLDRRQTNEPEP